MVEDSYGTRIIVRNGRGSLTDNNTKLGPIKKTTQNLSEIVPAVDDSSPGAVKENKLIRELKNRCFCDAGKPRNYN